MSLRIFRFLLTLPLAGLLVVVCGLASGQTGKSQLLRIGTSGNLASSKTGKENAALDTLHRFIKDETAMDAEIVRNKNWQQLAAKLSKGELQLGVFQGYEFAWAQAQDSALKPLAIAVNVVRYPVAYVITHKDDPAKTFADLEGHSLSLPTTAPPFVNLYVARQCQALGNSMEKFFPKLTHPDIIEDGVDDVVDRKVQVNVADRAALEAYKRSKPGRFKQLKMVARSEPFPPPVVAYYNSTLESGTLQRFEQGLLNASKKERGEMMLTLFRLTSFEAVPSDFDKVLAETLKHYPPPKS
jgi:ABC-type phosphate/phosphonate transport system substrate-binding protein